MTIPASKYLKAFKTIFPKVDNNLQIKKDKFANTYIIYVENKYYRIAEYADLRLEADDLLNSPMANEIPIDIWIEQAGDMHNNIDFQNDLFKNLAKNQRTWDILSEAFDQNTHSPDALWRSLQRLEEIDIYPAAINTAVDYLDNDLADKLTKKLIEIEFFNEMQNGIFEVVENGNETFYIYSIGEVNW